MNEDVLPKLPESDNSKLNDLIEDAKKDLDESRDCDDVRIRNEVRDIFIREVYSLYNINKLFDKLNEELFDKDHIILNDTELMLLAKLKGDFQKFKNNTNKSLIFILDRHTNY